jgi:hypothetical protein
MSSTLPRPVVFFFSLQAGALSGLSLAGWGGQLLLLVAEVHWMTYFALGETAGFGMTGFRMQN